MSWWKRKEIKFSQLVYDTTYVGECPLCKLYIRDIVHKIEDYNGRHHEEEKIISECVDCHVAVWIKKSFTIRRKQVYITDLNEPFGLKKISDEVLCEN